MINKKIIICSTVKNEARNLNKFFKLLDGIIYGFKDYFIIFVESDSKDNSSNIIKKYLSKKKGIIINHNLNDKYNRIKSLEISRNVYLDFIKSNQECLEFDYLFVLDVDGVNNILNYNKIKSSLEMKTDWNAIFPNQKFYYDIFALRIEGLIEENFVKRIKKDHQSNKYNNLKENFKKNLTRYFKFIKPSEKRFIKVKSAFGGCGIYKLKQVIEFRYNSFEGEDCEHVKLNEDLNKKYGKLYIDTELKNSFGINKHTINGFLCSKLNFFANRFFLKIK